MRRRSTIAAAMFTATMAMSAVTAVSAFAGLTNGNFEAGTHGDAPFEPLFPGDTQLTGWTVEAGSIEWIGSYWQPSEGSRSIDLNAYEAGTISQTIETTVGNTYTLTFDLSANPECGNPVKTLTVQASGAEAGAFAYDTAATGNTVIDMKWDTRTYLFVATSDSTKLTFASTLSGPCGPALDDLVVTETVSPSPSTPPSPSASPSPSTPPSPSASPSPSTPPSPSASPSPSTPPSPSVARSVADCKDGGWRTMLDARGNAFRNQGDCVSYVATEGRNSGAVSP